MIGELLKVGDKVVVNIPDENWEWGYRPFPKQKGTIATVSGFGTIHYSRIQSFGKEPGIYVNHSWVKIAELNDDSISTCFMELADKEEYEKRRKSWNHDKFEKAQKPIAPLPEMEFWEQDVVSFKPGCHNPWDHKEVQIAFIEYNYLGQFRNDGVTPMPEYAVCPIGAKGCHCSVNASDLKLVRRGNVWKFFHGEKLSFDTLQDEADFHNLIGKVNEVKNPQSGNYAWTFKQIIDGVRAGTIDGMTVSHGIMGIRFDEPIHHAQRFEDRGVGERVRLATMEGFKDVHFCEHKGCENRATNEMVNKSDGSITYRCDKHVIDKGLEVKGKL